MSKMEDLKNLQNVLENIKDTCLAIKKRALSVMERILIDSEEFVAQIQVHKPHTDQTSLKQLLENLSCGLVEDASSIQNEIGKFSHILAQGKDVEECECSFFKDVWFGDAYDGKSGLEGLEALLKDLEIQYDRCTIEHIVSQASQKNVE